MNKQTAGTVLLAEEEDDNMVSAWVDYIYAHRLADGSYSVTAEKHMIEQEESDECEIRTIESIEEITTPSQFIDAVNECSKTIGINIHWNKAIKALSELDEDFSIQVGSLLE
jgi:hypothetical protein